MSGTKKESHWIPLADLMTVLMIIFLFMAISYMAIVEKRQKEQNKIFKDYEESKVSLYKELNEAFKNDEFGAILGEILDFFRSARG